MLLSINGYTQEGIVFEFGQGIYVGGHKVENNSNSSRSDQLYFKRVLTKFGVHKEVIIIDQ